MEDTAQRLEDSFEIGAGDGTRTRNFQLGKLTLYH